MDFLHLVPTVDSSTLYISPTSVQRVALRGEKPTNRPLSNQNIGVCPADNPASKIQQNKSKKQTSLFDPSGGVRSPIHTMLARINSYVNYRMASIAMTLSDLEDHSLKLF